MDPCVNSYMLFTPNCDSTTWMSQQELKLIRPGNFCPLWPILVGIVASVSCSQLNSSVDYATLGSRVARWHTCWAAVVSHLLQYVVCCTVRSAFMHTLVDFKEWFWVTAVFQSDHFSLTCSINKAFSSIELLLTWYFLIFRPFSVNLTDVHLKKILVTSGTNKYATFKATCSDVGGSVV